MRSSPLFRIPILLESKPNPIRRKMGISVRKAMSSSMFFHDNFFKKLLFFSNGNAEIDFLAILILELVSFSGLVYVMNM
jgi:hypothetical protein